MQNNVLNMANKIQMNPFVRIWSFSTSNLRHMFFANLISKPKHEKKKHHGRVARAVQQMILKGLRIKSNRYGFATI
jgi:hypothetical protein